MKLPHIVLSGAIALCLGLSAQATVYTFAADLTGAAEAPPNSSTATGSTMVVYDDMFHTLTIDIVFAGLTAGTTAAHIHAAAMLSGSLTAGVATTVPNFAGFPLGVTSGSYNDVLDLTLAGSYNPAFVTNNGGTTASAEAALFSYIQMGNAYVNVHTSAFPGGEIRGFLVEVPDAPTVPETATTALFFSFALGVMGLVARRSRVAA